MSKRLTQKEFIDRATRLHPELDFSQSIYINSAQKVSVVCKKHGIFSIKPGKLFFNQGCSKCSRRLSKDDILKKISPFNINNYDLSIVDNLDYFASFTLKCLKHGDFCLVPANIISNGLMNCPKCSREKLSLTRNTFIERSKELHGDKFDYSLVDYTNLETKVIIKCDKGHIFTQRPEGHLKSKSCPKCGGHGQYSQDDFLFKARQVHGDKYDLSKVEYINHKIPVTIICPIHKNFFISPFVFLRGSGCKQCSIYSQTKSQEQFVAEAHRIHNNLYDLSKVVYKNSHTNVIVTCTKHGDFCIKPNKLLIGQGCSQCSERYTTKEYIKAVEDKHGKMFDYSLVEYQGSKNFITIICFNGHLFKRKAGLHLLNCSGCKECLGINKKTTAQFIQAAKKIHGDKFDYSKVVYEGIKTKVQLICSRHGSFWVVPINHIQKMQGCPRCFAPKGEKLIMDYLDNRDLKYIHNASFKGCRSVLPLRFDFYIPEFNTCIEFDGEGHFEPIWGKEVFDKCLKHDQIKTQFCFDNMINLIRITKRNKEIIYLTLDNTFFNHYI